MIKFNLKNIKEYLLTIIVSIIIVVTLCFCVQLELLFRIEEKINTQELNTQNLLEFCTIEQLEKQLELEPKNYVISIKLALLYETLQKYKKANEYYLQALKNSERSNFALYSYAIFCAKRNLYSIATTLCEEIKGNTKKTIEYKAKIYEAIGDNLINQKNYTAATKAFQVSYKYAKNISSKKDYNEIRNKYADSYAKSADYHMENSMVEEAISDLENSLKIKKNPIANYKLGLIYRNVDKIKAESNINQAFKKNPYIVNPYIYNDLLEEIIKEAELVGNQNELNIYSMKLNRFKKELEEAYIYKNDITIDNTEILAQKKFLTQKTTYFLKFDIKNNTELKMNDLFVEIELFINSQRHVLNKKIASSTHPLEYYSVIQDIKIELPKEIKLLNINKQNDIIAKYYVKKRNKAPWTLAKIEMINF